VYFFFNQTNRPADVGLTIADDDVPASKESAALARTSDAESSWPRALVINVAVIGAFYFFLKFIRYSLLSWAPYLLKTSYGMHSDQAGYLSTVFEVAGAAGMVLCGTLSDKLFASRRTNIALIFMVGVFVSCGMLYLLGTRSLALFTISMGLIGFTLYGPDGLMSGAGAVDVGSAKRATMAAAAINGMGSVGSVVQDLLLGKLLKSGSVATVFAVLLLSSFLALLCLVFLLMRNRRGSADV
ncbi:MAG: MFS transporter, partial [Myxococcales bacterium]|nr:MFS transporter [Myxococcales bacterium]